MLWNVAHLWRRGSRFTFNRYRHWGICIVWDRPGSPAIVIHSKEGVTQGDCRAMSIYGVGLMPPWLHACGRLPIPDALQPWFADRSFKTWLNSSPVLSFTATQTTFSKGLQGGPRTRGDGCYISVRVPL
ncbi:hypothetical protein ACHAXR_000568 [Thalassiosira sp. AJA248-18]